MQYKYHFLKRRYTVTITYIVTILLSLLLLYIYPVNSNKTTKKIILNIVDDDDDDDTNNNNNYSASVGKSLMYLNAAVLCPTSHLAAWNCSRCVKNMFFTSPTDNIQLIIKDHKNLLALIGISDIHKTIYIIIRGTLDSSFEDWLLDFEFWQKQYPMYGSSAYVHHGFLDAWNYLKNDVKNAINNVFNKYPNTKDYEVAISGHSMGASVSTLMMADFMSNQTQTPGLFTTTSNGGKENYMYTMGQPRTGNHNFSQSFTNQLFDIFGSKPYRIVNKADIVPHLPPDGNTLGAHYHHISNEVWIAPNGTTYVCNGSGEDPSCSDSLKITQLKPSDHTGYYGLNAGPCSK